MALFQVRVAMDQKDLEILVDGRSTERARRRPYHPRGDGET